MPLLKGTLLYKLKGPRQHVNHASSNLRFRQRALISFCIAVGFWLILFHAIMKQTNFACKVYSSVILW